MFFDCPTTTRRKPASLTAVLVLFVAPPPLPTSNLRCFSRCSLVMVNEERVQQQSTVKSQPKQQCQPTVSTNSATTNRVNQQYQPTVSTNSINQQYQPTVPTNSVNPMQLPYLASTTPLTCTVVPAAMQSSPAPVPAPSPPAAPAVALPSPAAPWFVAGGPPWLRRAWPVPLSTVSAANGRQC